MAYVSQFTGPQMDQAFGNALNQRPTYTLYLVDDGIDQDNIMDFAEFVQALSNNAIFQIKHLHKNNSSHSGTILTTDITAVSNAITQRSSRLYELVWEDTTFGLERYKLEVMSAYTSWDNVSISYTDILNIIPGDGMVTFPKIAGQGVLPTDFARLRLLSTRELTGMKLGLSISGNKSVNHTFDSPCIYWASGSNPYEMNTISGIQNSKGVIRRPILGFSPAVDPLIDSIEGSNRYTIVCPVIRNIGTIGIQIIIDLGSSLYSSLSTHFSKYELTFNSSTVFGLSKNWNTIKGDLSRFIEIHFGAVVDTWPNYEESNADIILNATLSFSSQ